MENGMERYETEETEKSYPDMKQEQTEMNQQEKHKNRMPVYVLSVVLAALVLAAAAIGLRKNQASASEDMTPPRTAEGPQEKWQEGTVSYNGKKYKYNSSIKSYLFMGIDKEGPVEEAEDSVSGGQSDAMFLIVTNSKDKSISVVSIHRNTMTKIEACDRVGLNKQEIMGQICIQHGYGDGKHYSCSKSADAVSYLFYNLPISGYISLNMGGIPMLNDAVGGVEVTALQDIAIPERGVGLYAGETKTLSGEEAYWYLRSRDMNEFDSASDRLRRQEQYITSFMAKAKTAIAGDAERATEIYNSISDYLVTDVDFVSFLSDLVSYEPDENGMYTVPGEAVMGEVYEEFYVDDDALYDLIIQIFYEEVE